MKIKEQPYCSQYDDLLTIKHIVLQFLLLVMAKSIFNHSITMEEMLKRKFSQLIYGFLKPSVSISKFKNEMKSHVNIFKKNIYT